MEQRKVAKERNHRSLQPGGEARRTGHGAIYAAGAAVGRHRYARRQRRCERVEVADRHAAGGEQPARWRTGRGRGHRGRNRWLGRGAAAGTQSGQRLPRSSRGALDRAGVDRHGSLRNAPVKLIRHPARVGHDAQRCRVAGIEAVRGGRHLRQPRCRQGEQLLVLPGDDVGAEVQHAVRVQQLASGGALQQKLQSRRAADAAGDVAEHRPPQVCRQRLHGPGATSRQAACHQQPLPALRHQAQEQRHRVLRWGRRRRWRRRLRFGVNPRPIGCERFSAGTPARSSGPRNQRFGKRFRFQGLAERAVEVHRSGWMGGGAAHRLIDGRQHHPRIDARRRHRQLATPAGVSAEDAALCDRLIGAGIL